MATIFEVPLPDSDSPRLTQITSLDGRDYVFTFDWNAREGKWLMELATADGVPLIQGVKLVANFPILRTLADDLRPPGLLYLTTPDGLDPDLQTISDARLVYVPEAELGSF